MKSTKYRVSSSKFCVTTLHQTKSLPANLPARRQVQLVISVTLAF
ncbi:hypothetical protein [Arenibacter echinorum]|nr:hypothetical protein [Arenibacter echinorum]